MLILMSEFGMHEAKTKLSQLVALAERGEEVVITRNGKPAARLTAVTPAVSRESVYGIWRGQVHMADDFDELPDDIAEAFGANE
jgi:prevent-host-death family protein